MKTVRLGHDGSRGEIGTPSPASSSPGPGGPSFALPAAGPTAYHEAGHAVAAWAFSVPITVVSIRPGAAYRGIALLDTGPYAAATADWEPWIPALFQPSETRAAIERAIVVSLVGSNPGVRALPSHWVPIGTPDDVISAKHAAMRTNVKGATK
jgi:hypothetical protein